MEPLLSFVKEQLKGLNHNEMLFYSNLVFRFLDRTFSILLPFFGSSEFLLVNRRKKVLPFIRRLKKRAWTSIVQPSHQNNGHRHALASPPLY